MDDTHENFGAPVMLGAAFVHVFPPSRVTWTLPSSVPAHTTEASRGLSAIEMIVQWNSARVLSVLIGPPLDFCFSGSFVERSGLIAVHVPPRSVVLNRTFPP